MSTRLRLGDPVTLTAVPGLWRIVGRTGDWVTVIGLDDFAKILASLSPSGRVEFTRNELIPHDNQETLL